MQRSCATASWFLAYPEARAALAAARRAGRLTARAMTVRRTSAHCVATTRCTSLALALGPGDTILATWDRDLSSAAADAGLAVAPAL